MIRHKKYYMYRGMLSRLKKTVNNLLNFLTNEKFV